MTKVHQAPNLRRCIAYAAMFILIICLLIKCLGLLNYVLRVKKGIPMMLLRNIDQALCNSTQFIIVELGVNIIGAEIIFGNNVCERVYIPRRNPIPSNQVIPF